MTERAYEGRDRGTRAQVPSRRAARPLLPAVLLSLLLVPAGPAAAAGGITSPGAGEVVPVDTVVALRAVVDGPAMRPSELVLVEPGTGNEQVVAVSASPDGGELAADLDTACAQPGCTGRAPARNGTWTLRLRGAADDERSFELRIPPAVPSDVAAQPSGQGVLLEWARGAEPDLTGYAVEDADGAPVLGGVGLDACDPAGRCRVEVPGNAGAWAVRAVRRTCPDCVTTLRSEPSSPVRVAAADSPSPGTPLELPRDQPEPGGAAQQVPDQRSAFARAFGAGRPAVAEQRPVVPPPAARDLEPGGSYDVELDYAAPPAHGAGGTTLEESLAQLSAASRVQLLLLSGLLVGSALWLRRWACRAVAD